MGEVFEAYDRDSDEVIAVKTLSRADGDTLTRFKREFRALQMTAHPNLVSLGELVRDGERWFFTMELVEGQHLLEYVKGDVARLRQVLPQLVLGLRALHGNGLIHRDVKPSNVMVTPEGRVVIFDFGLVTALDPANQSTHGQAIGTVDYMAPEQAVGHKVTEAADWYAVGVMIYEALTGRVPHSGHALQILVDKQHVEPVRPDLLAPGSPPDLVQLCVDLLAIEPAKRPDGHDVSRRLGIGPDSEPRRITKSSMGSARTVFVGRERELAELASSLARLADRPMVHLVVGESGIGKSELVGRFVRLLTADDPSTLVLAGRCYERESVPFKALDGVADGLAQELARISDRDAEELLPPRPSLLVRLFPVFQRVNAIASARHTRDDRGEPHELRRQMFGALRHLLAAVASRRRVVVTIDDLQWADADSFLLLRELLRGAGAPRVLVLATVRAEAGAAETVVEQLSGLTPRRTALGPLSPDESRALAEELLPGAGQRVDLARVAREAGGHPMFLHEILRHLDGLGGGATTATLDDALWSRVGLLPPDARSLLEAICVAGAPIALDVASAACGLDGTQVGRAAASLRVASLAREIQRGRGLALEPYHDRVREAVSGHLTAEARSALHARLAVALEASGGPRDPQLLLRHFTLGQMPDRAARYAEEAAERSLAAHAFDQAAELWRSALELVPRDDDDRRRVLLRLGEALVMAGRGAEAAGYYLAAAEGADRATRLECHRHASEQLLVSGRIAEGVASLDALLSEIGVQVPRTPRRALLSLLRHRAQLRLRGLHFKERHRREIADAELLRLDVLSGAAHGLALVDSIRGADFQTRQLLLSLKSGYRPQIARGILLESLFQSTNGHLARAASLIESAVEIAGDEPEPYLQGVTEAARGILEYFAGRAPRAVASMEAAETIFRKVPGSTWELSTTRLFWMFAMRWIGDYATMRVRHERFAADAQQWGDRYLESSMRRVCVPMWLADDNPEQAARELERATWVPESHGFHVQHFHELVARGEIAIYTGRPADHAVLQQGLDRLAGAMLLRIASIRTQVAYLEGRVAASIGAPRRVVEKHARTLLRQKNPVADVWAHLVRAGAAMNADDTGAAIAILASTADEAAAIGMRLSAAAARLRLARLRNAAGDDELARTAMADMTVLGVRAPERMAALLIPTARRS
jgi:tRNA A-37 threonylcarbamoyl transferase component Bud32/tetratricopeptide (TPR) repeat protein